MSSTMSSTEAEYIALTYATKEINWIQHLLRQVGYIGNDLKPLHLHSDNQPGINMVLNDGHHDRTKHFDSHSGTRGSSVESSVTSTFTISQAPRCLWTSKIEHAKSLHLINMVEVPSNRIPGSNTSDNLTGQSPSRRKR